MELGCRHRLVTNRLAELTITVAKNSAIIQ